MKVLESQVYQGPKALSLELRQCNTHTEMGGKVRSFRLFE